MRKLLLLFLFLSAPVLYSVTIAQSTEPLLTQFYNSPMLINPASTGLFTSDGRFYLNYKTQWGSMGEAFNTTAFSGEIHLWHDQETSNLYGLGLSVVQNTAGSSGYNNLATNLSFSANRLLNSRKTQFLSVGVQVGYVQTTIGASSLNWENQWTGDGFNPTITTPDQAYMQSNGYLDLGFGLKYSYVAKQKDLKLYVGIAGQHLTTPSTSFYETVPDSVGSGVDVPDLPDAILPKDPSELVNRKYNISAGVDIGLPKTKGIYIYPSMIFGWQGQYTTFIYGADIRYSLNEMSRHTNEHIPMSVSFGVYNRWKETISPVVKFEIGTLAIGISYDIQVGNISRVTNGQNALEFSLKYNVNFKNAMGSSSANRVRRSSSLDPFL